jgi:outer membrane receptor protein involved in Fe transport
MAIQRYSKAALFSGTVLAGLAAAAISAAPALAQTQSVPPSSPAAGAPPEAAADPAIVDQPDNPEEARNQSGEPVADDEADVEAVVVTGSRIRRDPTNSPAPLIQLGREEVLQQGESNVVDFLADVPALQGSFVPEDQPGFLNAGGLSLLNLRNLGAVRTLVLVDGRRHVGSDIGTLSVDVDTIPSLLTENIEVVTGGQSALYGADAVSGVVNFILRRNFEGVEIDASLAQRNQDGQLSRRISGLAGQNLLDDRLNVYVFGEYQKADEVRAGDLDYLRAGAGLFAVDVDPSAGESDGVLDNILLRNVRTLNTTPGGLLVLANQPTRSPPNDPDNPGLVCPATAATTGFSANCFRAEPTTAFVFDGSGVARRPNFGSFRTNVGQTPFVTVGGDGRNPNTESGQQTRLPFDEAYRFQTGLNFKLTDSVQLFAEAKYVREESIAEGSPVFYNIGISAVGTGTGPGARQPDFFQSNTAFNIGLDNAYLSEEVRAAIRDNRRALVNASGQPTGQTVADPRAFLRISGGFEATETIGRTRIANRELERYVIGVRGDRDRLGFIDNFAWEAGYTYGKVESAAEEGGSLDTVRLQFQTDAVVDTAGIVGRGAGAIVCRVQLLAAQGIPVLNPASNLEFGANLNLTRGLQRTPVTDPTGRVIPADTAFAPNDPTITGCVPARIFGTGGFSPEARAYSQAKINFDEQNEQENFLAFASGELWDFWGAGPIGLAAGYEYRKESTEATGRSRTTGQRVLLLNVSPDFPTASYDAQEFFVEGRLPLLRNSPLGESAEISAAYRKSDYSTVGEVDTYSVQASYRPIRDILFRTTYGRASRIPNLGENFAPPSQTFANAFFDPCDALNISNTADPARRQNRITNCAALGIPAGQRIIYTSGVPGANAGNPNLEPEVSDSYTFSIALRPRFVPRLSVVFDYFDIKITNVIAGIDAPTLVDQCVSNATLNPVACASFTRDPANDFRVIDFVSGSLNYAASRARGIDFNARYSIDLADVIARDFGRLDYSLRGSYLIRREDFTNIADPSQADPLDATVGLPRVRLLSSLTYSPTDRLGLTWKWDYQTSQESFDSDFLINDPDNRAAEFLETGDYHQHDFNLRYDLRENVTLRAGVTNAFDVEPEEFRGATGAAQFDLFGRRYFVGLNVRLGAAARD